MITLIPSALHSKPPIQRPIEPNSVVSFWHFNCSCGKPVKADEAWWDGKGQVHRGCLKKE